MEVRDVVTVLEDLAARARAQAEAARPAAGGALSAVAEPAVAAPPPAAAPHDDHSHVHGSLRALALGALGVVYGDIGTSPLYALRECFIGPHAVAISHANVLGVLSLIFWSLIMVISVKYLTFVMRADNQGEGGILALLALSQGRASRTARRTLGHYVLLLLGLFGAALLYGDGMITPAISVLSAVEGLGVATSAFEPFILPITVGDPGRRSSPCSTAAPPASPRCSGR